MKKYFENLDFYIADVFDAHQRKAIKATSGLRFWDMKTPYVVHPFWCAMTILTETRLDEQIRVSGSMALLYHDVLEDTTKKLPKELDSQVVDLIKGMTFLGGIQEEMDTVWVKSKEIILLKLYDKTSNLLDAVWMKGKSRKTYLLYTKKLLNNVLENYGELNITVMAKSILVKEKI